MTVSDRLTPDEIARAVGLVLPKRMSQRATAYTDLLQPACDSYWKNRPLVPAQRKASE